MPHPIATLCLLLTLLVLQPAGAQPIQVFTSILPIQYLTDQIGGDRVATEVMVKPGHSPATFEPSPKQMAALSQTELFVRVGVPFEQAWIKKIEDVNPALQIIDVRTLTTEQGNVSDEPHQHDAHIWTDPLGCVAISKKIEQALIAADPDGKSYYSERQKSLENNLLTLNNALTQLLTPLTQRTFMVFHPAWGHFAERYSLTQIAIEHEGKSPGSRALTAIIQQAKNSNIKKLMVQPQFDKTQARTIANAINAELIEIDPLAYDFLGSIQAMARALATQ